MLWRLAQPGQAPLLVALRVGGWLVTLHAYSPSADGDWNLVLPADLAEDEKAEDEKAEAEKAAGGRRPSEQALIRWAPLPPTDVEGAQWRGRPPEGVEGTTGDGGVEGGARADHGQVKPMWGGWRPEGWGAGSGLAQAGMLPSERLLCWDAIPPPRDDADVHGSEGGAPLSGIAFGTAGGAVGWLVLGPSGAGPPAIARHSAAEVASVAFVTSLVPQRHAPHRRAGAVDSFVGTPGDGACADCADDGTRGDDAPTRDGPAAEAEASWCAECLLVSGCAAGVICTWSASGSASAPRLVPLQRVELPRQLQPSRVGVAAGSLVCGCADGTVAFLPFPPCPPPLAAPRAATSLVSPSDAAEGAHAPSMPAASTDVTHEPTTLFAAAAPDVPCRDGRDGRDGRYDWRFDSGCGTRPLRSHLGAFDGWARTATYEAGLYALLQVGGRRRIVGAVPATLCASAVAAALAVVTSTSASTANTTSSTISHYLRQRTQRSQHSAV